MQRFNPTVKNLVKIMQPFQQSLLPSSVLPKFSAGTSCPGAGAAMQMPGAGNGTNGDRGGAC